MDTIAIRRLRALPLSGGPLLDARYRLILLGELAGMGYRITNPELLDTAGAGIFEAYPFLVTELLALKGGGVDYVPLFKGFPNTVPRWDEYFARRLMGYLYPILRDYPRGTRLDSGLTVPDWLFDLSQFGADPITQLQDRALFTQGVADQAARVPDPHTEWMELSFVREDEVMDRLIDWLHATLYARSSISAAAREDVAALLTRVGAAGVELERVVFKETRALLLRHFWLAGDQDVVRALADTPTDLLRLFAALTDTDVSLSKPIRFPKLTRGQRRLVLGILEGASSLAEDLNRHRGLWLALGRGLHPGERAERFPKTAAAFAALRAGTVETFRSRTEALIRAGDAAGALAHLSARPGLMGRRIHELLRRFPGQRGEILSALASVAGELALKNLLVMRACTSALNDSEERAVVNTRGAIAVLENKARGALDGESLTRLNAVLDAAISTQMAARFEPLEGLTAWIDPALDRYTVPLQQREASAGVLRFGRGSRIPVALQGVLRLFVWWKQTQRRTDLDLSLLQLDADWGYLGHVSYTRLEDGGAVHSGDLQSAPHGAAEFIDVPLAALAPEVAHLVVQIYRYTGERFSEMSCRAGWMLRREVDARYESFDISTVVQCFELHGGSAYCVPLSVDLRRREIVMTDLYMGGKAFHNSVEGAFQNVARACRAVGRFTEHRPTLGDLARRHVAARGAVLLDAETHEASSADVSFGIRDCTYNATEVETILSELL